MGSKPALIRSGARFQALPQVVLDQDFFCAALDRRKLFF